jgi:hypothetical protein
MLKVHQRIDKLERATLPDANAPFGGGVFVITSDGTKTIQPAASTRHLDGRDKPARGVVIIADDGAGEE